MSIVAVTPDGRFPLVRQYRPALEDYTWELPCGTVDPGEDAAETCRRELLEETGFTTQAIRRLGNGSPCTGRLNNRIHAFHVATGEQVGEPELGITLRLVTARELARMIPRGRVRFAASHRLADAGRASRPDRATAPFAACAFGSEAGLSAQKVTR